MENNTICCDKNVKSKDEVLNYSKDSCTSIDKISSSSYHSTIIRLALLTKNLNSSFSISGPEACVSKLSVEGLDTLCRRLGDNCSFKRVDGFADGTYSVVIDCTTITKTNVQVGSPSVNNGIRAPLNNNCSILIYKPCEVKTEEQPKDLSMKMAQSCIPDKQSSNHQPITPRSPKDAMRLRKKILKNPRGRPKELGTHSLPNKVNLATILPKIAPARTSMKVVLMPKKDTTSNGELTNDVDVDYSDCKKYT